MITLDASVVIAMMNQQDRHHDRAIDLIDEHIEGGFVMHHMTIAEVLVGAVRSGRGGQRLSDLHDLGVVQSTASDALLLAELRASTGLKLPDCCVLAAALQASCPVATFDQTLGRAATELGLTVLN